MIDSVAFRGMPQRTCGRSGLRLSSIGLLLWRWGDPDYDGSRVGRHEGFSILDAALEQGITHWDTGNSYNAGSGNAERLLGDYLQARGSATRETILLSTKIRNSVRDPHQISKDPNPNEIGSSRKYIIQAVEGCLKRLKTDHIDILYHLLPNVDAEGNWETPLDEIWSTMADLVHQGKVHYLGLANRNSTQVLEESAALRSICGNTIGITAVQNRYSLADRDLTPCVAQPTMQAEQEFFTTLKQSGIGFVSHLSLTEGLLTGRYSSTEKDLAGLLSQNKGFWQSPQLTRKLAVADQMRIIAKELHATCAQTALAWILSNPVVASATVEIHKLPYLLENCQGASLKLPAEYVMRLNRISEF